MKYLRSFTSKLLAFGTTDDGKIPFLEIMVDSADAARVETSFRGHLSSRGYVEGINKNI